MPDVNQDVVFTVKHKSAGATAGGGASKQIDGWSVKRNPETDEAGLKLPTGITLISRRAPGQEDKDLVI